MLLLSGTMPIEEKEVLAGTIRYDGETISLGETKIPKELRSIGAMAMMAAAATCTQSLGMEPPVGAIAGDLGQGTGSASLYTYLTEKAASLGASALTMHYILPLRKPFMEFVEMLDYWPKRPFMIADAGSMLIAKATGSCRKFDLFTPDAGEICFLADPEAGHPAYVKSMLFEIDTTQVPKLIDQAYASGNAPRYMLIKGPVDFIVDNGKVVSTISEPNIPALEPIGGTGDTITGMVSALISGGYEPVKACVIAGRANRLAGQMTNPDPSTQVFQIIKNLGPAVRKVVDTV
ncbi:MAG TPA: NAD(P)H-hydrate dehydratase [Conexivisphaerales archaeon]|nr:NAD(P)H-hydrate dehydratase [Conexivisphaerales archaeon]